MKNKPCDACCAFCISKTIRKGIEHDYKMDDDDPVDNRPEIEEKCRPKCVKVRNIPIRRRSGGRSIAKATDHSFSFFVENSNGRTMKRASAAWRTTLPARRTALGSILTSGSVSMDA